MSAPDPEPGFLSLGQATARAIALRSASSDRLQRTLLVHGPAGADKQAFVDDLLALVFCTAEDASRPCNACRGCRLARGRSHPDLVVASPDTWREARGTGESIVAVARRWLLAGAGAPIEAPRRVIVIENADRANEQIQNALLKALEEPTGRHMFILVADEPMRLLPTIRSRSQSLRIGPVPHRELAEWLMERKGLPADQADTLVRLADGLAGTAARYADNPELVAWRRRTQGELLALLSRGRADRFAAVPELLDEASRLGLAPVVEDPAEDGPAASLAGAAQRQAATQVVEAWLDLTRDLLVASAGRPALAPSADLLPELPRLASGVSSAGLLRSAALLERIHDGLRQNAAPRLALEAAMLAWPTVQRESAARAAR